MVKWNARFVQRPRLPPQALREILRLRREKIDLIEQLRFRMKHVRIIQNRNRLFEMSIFQFQLCKLQQSRRERRRFYLAVAQIVEQLPSSISVPDANFKESKMPSGECPSRLFRIAHPFFQFAP